VFIWQQGATARRYSMSIVNWESLNRRTNSGRVSMLPRSPDSGVAGDHKTFQPHFMLVPSLACPAECSYCFGPDNGPSMSAETMDAALDFMARIVGETNQKKVKVTFHGGEPLMAGHALWDRALEGLETRFWLPEMRSGRAEQPVAADR